MSKKNLNIKQIGRSCIVLGTICLLVSGCNPKETVNNSEVKETVATENKVETVKEIKIDYKNYEETIYNDEKEAIINLSIKYPVLIDENKSEGTSKINSYYEEVKKDFIERVKDFGVEMAEEDIKYAKENKLDYIPHEYGKNIELVYNENEIMSFLGLEYMNTGGAHPNSIQESYNFDLVTGEKLTLSETMGISKEEALNKVYEKVDSEIKAKEESEEAYYFEEYPTSIKENFDDTNFYITEKGITLYYQVYVLAPYAAGYPTFELSKEELGENFILNK